MGYLRVAVCAAVLVACAVLFQASEAKASRFEWKSLASVQNYLANNPGARRMTEGPLDPIIDLIIQILIQILTVVLDGLIPQGARGINA